MNPKTRILTRLPALQAVVALMFLAAYQKLRFLHFLTQSILIADR